MSYHNAKSKVESVCEKYGKTIELIKEGTENDWGEAIDEIKIEIKSFPIRFSPFDKVTELKVGFSYDVDVLCFVPKEILDNKGYDIDLYVYIVIDNKRYRIYKVQPYSLYGDNFLYYIIGGKK